MVTFPDFSSIANNSNIGTFLSLPNSSYPYFWAWILGGLWIIVTFSLYFTEKDKIGKGKLLASMSVACFAIIVLSTLGTIIGVVSLEIMIYILVISMMIIGVWFFTTRN